MIFEKNSTRTRFSFDAAIRQLGGASIIANAGDMQLGRGEPVEDTARVLSRMVDAVMIRANSHEDVERFARVATVPVVNGLTDRSHPCQILADIMTIEEQRGPIEGKTIAWIGDGNNVCHSFIHAAPKLGFHLNVACPAEYHPDLRDLARGGHAVTLTSDPKDAVRGADVVVTDTWVSMGDGDYEARLHAFESYTVDEALMDLADPDAVFLHCLPAHRGEEVTDAVIDGPRSLVWDEAENRIHAQKAVLAWCFAG
jgi:ornithine carbamoyltransferase